MPGREDLDALAVRLRSRGLDFAADGRSITVTDPWDTRVTVTLPGTTIADPLA